MVPSSWRSTLTLTLGPVRDRLFGDVRLQRAIEHIHRMGPRPVGELIAELLETAGGDPCVLDDMLRWTRLDPDIVRKVGADRFPRPPLDVVPTRDATPKHRGGKSS